MIVVKLKWDIIEKEDRVLLILPNDHSLTHPDIISIFRETIKKIKCAFVAIIIPHFNDNDILKYEELYDTEFQFLKNVSSFKNDDFLKHHNSNVMYILQDTASIMCTSFFTKIIIDTLNCSEVFVQQLKSLNVPIQYGMCVFNEIITMNIFMKGTISLIVGEIKNTLFFPEKKVDMIFNCSGFFIKNSVAYEEPTICIDVLHDLTYRLNEMNTIPIFIGKFRFDNPQIEKLWQDYFTKTICIYDIDAYETLRPTENYRISKDIPNLLKMYYSNKSDLLCIHL
jgi:hypothetical protein